MKKVLVVGHNQLTSLLVEKTMKEVEVQRQNRDDVIEFKMPPKVPVECISIKEKRKGWQRPYKFHK